MRKEPPKFAPGGRSTQAVGRYLSTLGRMHIGTLFKVLLHNYLVLPDGLDLSSSYLSLCLYTYAPPKKPASCSERT